MKVRRWIRFEKRVALHCMGGMSHTIASSSSGILDQNNRHLTWEQRFFLLSDLQPSCLCNFFARFPASVDRNDLTSIHVPWLGKACKALETSACCWTSGYVSSTF